MKESHTLSKNIQAILKHIGYFQEKSMTLCPSFSQADSFKKPSTLMDSSI